MNPDSQTSQQSTLVGKNVFRDVIPLCRKNYEIMKEVFLNPEQVMAKFILNIYHGKLQVIPSILSNMSKNSFSTSIFICSLFRIT